MPDLKTRLTDYVREQTPESTPPFQAVQARLRRRSQRRAAAASLAVVTALGAGAVQLTQAPSDGGGGPAASTASDRSPGPLTNPTGAVPDTGLTSCALEYDRTTLSQRAFAFDGTVVDIEPTQRPGFDSTDVTFRVEQWFRGGSQAEVTLPMSVPTDDVGHPYWTGPDSEYVPTFGVGSRLLVSGEPRWGGAPLEDPVAWGCGFTRYHDEATAADWALAFG